MLDAMPETEPIQANIEDAPVLEEASDQEPISSEEMVEIFHGRSDFYRLLSFLFFRPLSQEQIDAMAEKDFSVFGELNELCGEGANDIYRYLRKRNSGTRRELAADFTSVFGGGHTWKGRYATPYQSLFEDENGQQLFSVSYRQVFLEYHAAAVEKAPGVDYPEDHISFMCEFLAIQSDRAAEAVLAGNNEEAISLIDNSLKFIDEHILSWYGDMEDLALKMIETRFYRGVLKIARGFFEGDVEQLKLMREELEEENA